MKKTQLSVSCYNGEDTKRNCTGVLSLQEHTSKSRRAKKNKMSPEISRFFFIRHPYGETLIDWLILHLAGRKAETWSLMCSSSCAVSPFFFLVSTFILIFGYLVKCTNCYSKRYYNNSCFGLYKRKQPKWVKDIVFLYWIYYVSLLSFLFSSS